MQITNTTPRGFPWATHVLLARHKTGGGQQ